MAEETGLCARASVSCGAAAVFALLQACSRNDTPPPLPAPQKSAAAAVVSAPPAPAPEPDRFAEFLTWAATAKSNLPKAFPGYGCEEGRCSGSHDPPNGRPYFATWLKKDPRALILMTSVDNQHLLNCETLGEPRRRRWTYGKVERDLCGAGDTRFLIEHNRGVGNYTKLLVFSKSYPKASPDFQKVLDQGSYVECVTPGICD